MKAPGVLVDWWGPRAPRERGMLAVMVLAIAAFLAWFAVVRPLARWQQDAAAGRQAAAATLAEVRAARAGLAAFHAALPEPASMPMDELLPRTAAAAGVALSRQQLRDGLLTVGVDSVDAPALLAWLDALARHGVAPLAMDVGERDGRLHAEFAFVGAPLPEQAAGIP